LTSGNAAAVDNPASYFESTNNSAAGDADLSGLSGNATFDACILEFDFVANGDSVNFRYQFGSEEYPNYTCTEFNDVFGFFISGPGYGSPTNIALVPGTTIPVAINSVNGGSPTGAGVLANCQAMGPGSPFPAYFIDNTGFGAPAYDGLTVVLNAKAAVVPCSTYHFKLGVADASDFILSSGVFLEQGSLTVLPPTIIGCPANITAISDICGKLVTWTPPHVNSCLPVSSTASHNPGDFFPIGTTTVTYTFTNAGGTSTCTFDVTVVGETPTCTISVTPSDTTCTGGVATNIYLGYGPQSATLTANPSGGSSFTYLWSGPTSYLSCTTCQSPVFTPTIGGTYTFTVTVTNNFGCKTTCTVTFCVKDVRAPSNGNNQKIYVCHIPPGNPLNPQTISISVNGVPAHVCLHGGDQLGYCGQTCGAPVARYITGNGPATPDQVTIAPNPNTGVFKVTLPHVEDQAQLLVTDMQGKVIQRRMLTEKDGQIINVQLGNVPYGVYLLDVYYSGEHYRTKLEILK
jgi:PKD repeat protein